MTDLASEQRKFTEEEVKDQTGLSRDNLHELRNLGVFGFRKFRSGRGATNYFPSDIQKARRIAIVNMLPGSIEHAAQAVDTFDRREKSRIKQNLTTLTPKEFFDLIADFTELTEIETQLLHCYVFGDSRDCPHPEHFVAEKLEVPLETVRAAIGSLQKKIGIASLMAVRLQEQLR